MGLWWAVWLLWRKYSGCKNCLYTIAFIMPFIQGLVVATCVSEREVIPYGKIRKKYRIKVFHMIHRFRVWKCIEHA